jgi:hypothetical protein
MVRELKQTPYDYAGVDGELDPLQLAKMAHDAFFLEGSCDDVSPQIVFLAEDLCKGIELKF